MKEKDKLANFSQNIFDPFENLDIPENAFKQTQHISLDIGEGVWRTIL
jgi:hypothetical protein